MKSKTLALLSLASLFAGKYLQIALLQNAMTGERNDAILMSTTAIIAVASLIILISSAKALTGRWRISIITLAAVALAMDIAYMAILNPYLYLGYNLAIATSLFLLLYPLHSYETKKYAAFGYAFLLMYSMTEGVSLIRMSYDAVFFATYLTISLAMFVPGIMKIKENQ